MWHAGYDVMNEIMWWAARLPAYLPRDDRDPDKEVAFYLLSAFLCLVSDSQKVVHSCVCSYGRYEARPTDTVGVLLVKVIRSDRVL